MFSALHIFEETPELLFAFWIAVYFKAVADMTNHDLETHHDGDVSYDE